MLFMDCSLIFGYAYYRGGPRAELPALPPSPMETRGAQVMLATAVEFIE